LALATWGRIIHCVEFYLFVIISPVGSVENDAFQSKSCADQLKALSEPIRLRIIDVLRHGEMTVGDIAEFLETELVTVSHHLKILKHADLVEVKREGRFMVYSLRSDLLQKASGRSRQYLNLGCCRIEVPDPKPE
jgi:DNA-binding transcriptional ArsR family regulator